MKRLALAAFVAAVLLVPAAMSAQSPSPAASPGAAGSPGAVESPIPEPPGPIGVDSQHVCLEIHGPVTLLTAESLTQGIMDGTFTIVGLSTQCDVGAGASPAASPLTGVTASPAASSTTGTAAGSPGASPAS